MKLRRLTLVAVGVVALTASALGVGVALGSRSSHAQSPGDKSSGAGALPRASTSKPTRPKAQAYAHFLPDGTLTGALTKNVIAVHHIATGRYCVELSSRIHVTDETFVQMTVDYFNSPFEFMVAMEGASSVCTGLGFANSVRIISDSNDKGTPVPADVAVFLTIP